ncbi:hypothetical protein D3C71_1456690 [compost metagenome]
MHFRDKHREPFEKVIEADQGILVGINASHIGDLPMHPSTRQRQKIKLAEKSLNVWFQPRSAHPAIGHVDPQLPRHPLEGVGMKLKAVVQEPFIRQPVGKPRARQAKLGGQLIFRQD